jgi:hypothetical protein
MLRVMGDVAELYDRFDPLVALDPTEVGLYVDWQAKLGLDDVKPRLRWPWRYAPTLKSWRSRPNRARAVRG